MTHTPNENCDPNRDTVDDHHDLRNHGTCLPSVHVSQQTQTNEPRQVCNANCNTVVPPLRSGGRTPLSVLQNTSSSIVVSPLRPRGRPRQYTNDAIAEPLRRPGRPRGRLRGRQSINRNVRPRVDENGEHIIRHSDTLNCASPLASVTSHDNQTFESPRTAPQVIISSTTVIGPDGAPVHLTRQPGAHTPSYLPTSDTFNRNAPGISRLSPSSITLDESSPVNIERNSNTSTTNVYRTARQHRRMTEYLDSGDAEHTCRHCRATFWFGERTVRRSSMSNPRFSTCCSEGKVKLPLLPQPPRLLKDLLDYNGGERSRVFRKNIKVLCAMFSFTSTGGKIHKDINNGLGPYTFRLNGHNHHRIGSLLPMHDDGRPRFAQLYIYDTEHEVDNRLYALNRTNAHNDDEPIIRLLVQDLIRMLDEHNPLVQSFRMARERFRDSTMQHVTLRLISTRQRDGRQYNLPTASEVAALIPCDGNPTDSRDVIVESRGGEQGHNLVKRITELHPSFMALQYPLLFPYGEDGFRLYIPLDGSQDARRKYLSLRQFYCFRLQVRVDEGKTLHSAGRLFHTYVVDAYTAVLEHDLDWYKRNQDTIRSELYNGLHDHIANGETNAEAIGRRVILPSSFTGGPRHMIQQYQDAMAICRWAGLPDLFVSMTCNPRWPEIQRNVENTIPGQPANDRPDIITRMFKNKLDELMDDIKKRNHFGRVKAVIYTIEFQKRGLPHCHAIIFLHEDDKISSDDDIDHVISAEIPSEVNDPVGFEVVRTHMMHGPCGELNPSNSCMDRGVCQKRYPKEYCEKTFITRDGWPIYRRSNNGRRVKVGRNDVMLDNRYVVPHNLDLVVKYGCHINVEWCNQGSLVKYLFSYLNKGSDRATVVIEGQNNRTSFQSILRHNDEKQPSQISERAITSTVTSGLAGENNTTFEVDAIEPESVVENTSITDRTVAPSACATSTFQSTSDNYHEEITNTELADEKRTTEMEDA